MKKIFIVMNHPAHYHMFKNFYYVLHKKNFKFYFIIKEKDILEQLLIRDGLEFIKIISNTHKRRKNSFSILLSGAYQLFLKDIRLFKLAKNHKPDFMLGTDATITHIGKILNIPSFVFNEDDISVTPLFCYMSYPFTKHIISPVPCNVGKWEFKKIGYLGYQKLTYLHPKYFVPNIDIIRSFNPDISRYFILRFAKLTATHDLNVNGLNFDIAREVIRILKPYGKIFISSEIELDSEFEQLRLMIDPTQIHHVLYFANLLISDSQSMSGEAALLGTPSIRFSDFAGRISVLEELEHSYQLTFGINPSNPGNLYKKIEELLNTPNLNEKWQKRRQEMLADKIDVTAFMVWLIENYPKSAEIMRKDPEYQLRFK